MGIDSASGGPFFKLRDKDLKAGVELEVGRSSDDSSKTIASLGVFDRLGTRRLSLGTSTKGETGNLSL